jgi:hypothetical protein
LCRFLFSNIYINVNRFESEKKSFQKQIIEFQNNFDIGEKKIGILEFENSEYKLKSNTEIGRLNDILEEKDILLRKAAKEVSMLRTDCADYARKYEGNRVELGTIRLDYEMLRVEMENLHEGPIGI